MSGNSPEWIKPGHYFMHNGKKEIVENYFFVSNGMHNGDDLIVRVKGISHEFNYKTMQPLKPDGHYIPDFLRTGKIVQFKDSSGKDRLEFVRRVWMQQSAAQSRGRVMVQFENYPFDKPLDKIEPVSKANKAAAKKMKDDRKEERRKADSLKKFRKMMLKNNPHLKGII